MFFVQIKTWCSVVTCRESSLQSHKCNLNCLLNSRSWCYALFGCFSLCLCYSLVDQPGWQTWACCVQFTDNTLQDFGVFIKIFRAGFFKIHILDCAVMLPFQAWIRSVLQLCVRPSSSLPLFIFVLAACVASCWQSWLFQENGREASQCIEMRWEWCISIWKLLI